MVEGNERTSLGLKAGIVVSRCRDRDVKIARVLVMGPVLGGIKVDANVW